MVKALKYHSTRNFVRYAAVLSLIAPIYFMGISTYASIITPDYNVISQAYSVLARHHMPNAILMTTGFLGYALMIQTLGPLLFINVHRKSLGILIWALVFFTVSQEYLHRFTRMQVFSKPSGVCLKDQYMT